MKNKFTLYATLSGLLLLVIVALSLHLWFFEGEAPEIGISPKAEIMGREITLKLEASDTRRGLSRIVLRARQDSKEVICIDDRLEGGPKNYQKEYVLRPLEVGLSQGKVSLEALAYDRSLRGGGEGNKASFKLESVIDTVPPAIVPVSPYHYFNAGGTGVVIYTSSKDTVESGVRFEDISYKGFLMKEDQDLWMCYFPLPTEISKEKRFTLYARDRAGNLASTSFSYQIKPKKFRADTIVISEKFIKDIIPYFESIGIPNNKGSLFEWFKYINTIQREKDEKEFSRIAQNTGEKTAWEGVWLRMKNAAPKAGFGDKRVYRYEGQLIGESVHKGVDLASLINSPVEAANNGKVVFCGDLGIYGKTVVLDHGMGIHSTYSHLSRIDVSLGQEVLKGQGLGITGSTGLAGGDHLHFGVMVHGVFVNPIEWWDPLWIKEKITRWLEKGESQARK